jgi:hypothetical protein
VGRGSAEELNEIGRQCASLAPGRPSQHRRDFGVRRPRTGPLLVIDTSALIAILCGEPERTVFAARIEEAEERLLWAASLVEVSLVIATRYGPEGLRQLDDLHSSVHDNSNLNKTPSTGSTMSPGARVALGVMVPFTRKANRP